jgi:hypothetical protein
MNENQQRSISQNSEPETSQALQAFTKALMVDFTWTMAGLLKEDKSTSPNQQPPHRKQ